MADRTININRQQQQKIRNAVADYRWKSGTNVQLAEFGVPIIQPSNSPTPSITASVTMTPTVTVTPSTTISITPTRTPSNTITPTVTMTPTSTATPSNTTTPTKTPSNSATPSNTVTPSNTTTPTKTPSNTATPSVTVTPSNTITPSYTPSQTQTPSNTATPTKTPSNSTTPSQTQTPSNTVTPTKTPSNSASPPPSATPTVTPSTSGVTLPTIVFDLDAANYSAVPTNGSTVSGSAFTLGVSNAGSSITWNSANGGTFAKSNSTGTDVIYGGPNYVTGQSYTVFMAYKLSATSAGRLLNTQSEASKDWMMGAYNGNPNAFYPNFTVNLPSTGADTVWHFAWATWNSTTTTGQLWIATNTAPTAYTYTATSAGGGGFNQLRLFSRSSGSEVQSGNIAFVKVYNGVLTLAQIQSLHATYKTRMGY